MNKIMKNFLGELFGVLKNNLGSTSKSGISQARNQNAPANVEILEEPEPQGDENSEITYLQEFTRLPPTFDGTKGLEDAEGSL